MIKLNLGSGVHVRKGWISVDKYVTEEGIKSKAGWYKNAIWEKGGTFIQADIVALPFADNYADHIEMHQVLEHMPYRQIIPALTEVYRVMKKEARLILTVPNFDELALGWLNMRLKEFNQEEYIIHMENIYGVQTSDGEFHRCLFSPVLLNACLNTVGFTQGTIGAYPPGIATPKVGLIGIGKKQTFLRHGIISADMIK